MLYLARYVGVPSDDGSTLVFSPAGAGETPWSSIDLRPDCTVEDGWSILWTSTPLAPSPLRVVLGDDLDDRGPAVRGILNSRLGRNIASGPKLRRHLLELLLDPAPSGWKPLRPTRRRGRYEVWLGGELVDALVQVRGGATITDDFNRANNVALGNAPAGWSWTEVNDDMDIVTNRVQGPGGGSGNSGGIPKAARAEFDMDDDSHYAQANCTASTTNAACAGIAVRFDPAAHTYYGAYNKRDNIDNFLYKIVAGVRTNISSSTTVIADASLLRLEVDGSSLEMFDDGVSYLTGTDTSIVGFLRTGIVGASPGGSNRFIVDNFEAGDILSPILNAAAAGASTTAGSAAAKLDRRAAGAGASTTAGSASAAIVRTAAAAGSSTTAGTAAATRVMPATAAGASTTAGAAAASIAHPAAAAGASTTTGQAAALLDRQAAAAGASTTAGSAAGLLDLRAAAAGASTTAGTGAGVVALTAAAAGASTTAGTAAGALVRSASAAGASSTNGSAAGLLLLVVTASGASTTAGSAAANRALTAAAAGASTTAGVAAALLRLMASASGASITVGLVASFLPRRSSPTVAQVLDLDVGQVQASFVFVLVDATGTEIGRLSPLQAASLNHSTARRVYRRLDDLQIPPSEQAAVNPGADRVMVGMVVAGIAKGELGHVDTPLPWGEYVFDDRPREVESWGELWHGSLIDTTALLDDGLPVSVTYPAGYSLKTALAEQFELALFDRYDIEIPDYLTFGAPVSATVGTSRLEFMRAIAALGACGLWMANSRRGRVARIPVGDGHTPELAYEDGRNILRSSILLNDSKLRAPNRWVVQDTAQGSTTVGVWDLPASAENSAANRGRVITAPVRTVQGIPGSSTVERQANANAMAQADSVRDARAALTASCDGAIDPRHDTFDYVSLLATVYVEHAWSAKLDTGEAMSHELRVTYA